MIEHIILSFFSPHIARRFGFREANHHHFTNTLRYDTIDQITIVIVSVRGLKIIDVQLQQRIISREMSQKRKFPSSDPI